VKGSPFNCTTWAEKRAGSLRSPALKTVTIPQLVVRYTYRVRVAQYVKLDIRKPIGRTVTKAI